MNGATALRLLRRGLATAITHTLAGTLTAWIMYSAPAAQASEAEEPTTATAEPIAGQVRPSEADSDPRREPADSGFLLFDDNYFAALVHTRDAGRVKFQISIRYEMLTLGDDQTFSWSFAYTQKSFWDLFAFKRSSPFVENNYRPETFFSYRPFGDDRRTEISLGVQHESNGLGTDETLNQESSSRASNIAYLDLRGALAYRLDSWTCHLGGRVRGWVPFVETEPAAMQDALGYVAASVDVDWSRITKIGEPESALQNAIVGRARVTARRRSIDVSYHAPLFPAITSGHLRPTLFLQVFAGQAERLIPYDLRVVHAYAGFGFI